MQIPYDLEFIENRPSVHARAIVATFPSAADRRRERDVFDAFLSWVHRLIHRLEKHA